MVVKILPVVHKYNFVGLLKLVEDHITSSIKLSMDKDSEMYVMKWLVLGDALQMQQLIDKCFAMIRDDQRLALAPLRPADDPRGNVVLDCKVCKRYENASGLFPLRCLDVRACKRCIEGVASEAGTAGKYENSQRLLLALARDGWFDQLRKQTAFDLMAVLSGQE